MVRFFRTTWIPDETFFQTLVPHLVPQAEIRTRTLTFLMFTDYGMPVTFYNDHYDLLLSQDYLFARKISPGATELKHRLGELFASSDVEFTISNEGRSLFSFLTGPGPDWASVCAAVLGNGIDPGRERELMIVVCKKWHVAKRIIDRIRSVMDIPCIDYLLTRKAASCPIWAGSNPQLASEPGIAAR